MTEESMKDERTKEIEQRKEQTTADAKLKMINKKNELYTYDLRKS